MKIASACRQCRSSKIRCIPTSDGHHGECISCQRRSLTCSNAARPTRHRELALSTEKEDRIRRNDWLEVLPSDLVFHCVELYLRFVHDSPHSLFHEKTLWNEIRSDTCSQCLLAAICAVGCRFSSDPRNSQLGDVLRARASSLFAAQLETISLANIQTCILLANLYAAEQNNEVEALYFGIANRMAHVLRLHESNLRDPSVLREVKCRVYWSLFMADRWCPPSIALPREISRDGLQLDLPMDEVAFQSLEFDAHTVTTQRTEGLWKYMITLADILGPIQDLNQSLATTKPLHGSLISAQVSYLAHRLDTWRNDLPRHMHMSDINLEAYRQRGHGSTFVALHFGYHHYCTLLYFQYLDSSTETTWNTMSSPSQSLDAISYSAVNPQGIESYAARCRYHALSFSRLLHHARSLTDCPTVYLTVAYMTMISSSVLLHTFLFSESVSEVDLARLQLTRNFEALVDLRRYWPHLDSITERLLTFQGECLSRTRANELNRRTIGPSVDNKTHAVDQWMVRFLVQYGLPLETREISDSTDPSHDQHRDTATSYQVDDLPEDTGSCGSGDQIATEQLPQVMAPERARHLEQVFRNLR